MENEIAGKILSCLRSATKTRRGSLADSSSLSLTPSQSKSNENGICNGDTSTRETISSFVGFSFSQYIAQSVHGSKRLDLEDLEDFNYKIMKSKNENNER